MSTAAAPAAGQASRWRMSLADAPPGQDRGNGHQKEQAEDQGHRHLVKERSAHCDRRAICRLDHEREHGAEQDHEREGREKEIVGQESALTGDRREDIARVVQLVTSPRQQADAGGGHDPEEAEQVWPDVAPARK